MLGGCNGYFSHRSGDSDIDEDVKAIPELHGFHEFTIMIVEVCALQRRRHAAISSGAGFTVYTNRRIIKTTRLIYLTTPFRSAIKIVVLLSLNISRLCCVIED